MSIAYVIHDSPKGRRITNANGYDVNSPEAFRLAAAFHPGYWLEGEWRNDTGKILHKWYIWD